MREIALIARACGAKTKLTFEPHLIVEFITGEVTTVEFIPKLQSFIAN